MKTWACGLLSIVGMLAIPTAHADRTSFDGYLDLARSCPGGTSKDYPTYSVYVCDAGRTYYIITKPNHPAYPGVIIRKLVTEGGATYMQTDGHSFVDDDTAFKEWMRTFSN